MKLSPLVSSADDGTAGTESHCSGSLVRTIRGLWITGCPGAAFRSAWRSCSTSLILWPFEIIVVSLTLSIFLIDFCNTFFQLFPINASTKQAACFFHRDFESMAHGRDGVRFHCLA